MIVGATLAAALATASGASVTHSWQFVGASNDAAMFVDDSTIAPDGPYRVAWVIGIEDPSSEIAKESPGAYSMTLHRIDCQKRTEAIDHLWFYSPAGDVLGEKANPYASVKVAPYSTGEVLYQYVCNGVITTDKSPKLHSLDEVKSFGKGWLELYDELAALPRGAK